MGWGVTGTLSIAITKIIGIACAFICAWPHEVYTATQDIPPHSVIHFTYMHTYTHTYIRTHTHTYVHTCIHTAHIPYCLSSSTVCRFAEQLEQQNAECRAEHRDTSTQQRWSEGGLPNKRPWTHVGVKGPPTGPDWNQQPQKTHTKTPWSAFIGQSPDSHRYPVANR